ncbi:MAG: hypothetical protein IT548_11740 [Alphaproteobacteria bacterium]|nr:hypothetical protein [Alphaproteobacteria bacterium]
MKPILSPTEILGLAGVALEGRVKQAIGHIGDRSLARIAQNLRDEAKAAEFVYEHDGVLQPIPIMLRPLLAMREQLDYVHAVCNQMMDALKNMPSLYLADPDIRRILKVTEGEDRWLRDIWTPAHDRLNTVYGRLDAVCDFSAAGWQDSLKFMEANLSGVGGISYSPLAEALVMQELVPSLRAHDPGLGVEMPRDQRDLFIQALIDHSRALGRSDCGIAFVEAKYADDGICEQVVLQKLLSERHRVAIAHADPSELYVKDGQVFYEDQCIDVIYRDYEARDFIALEEELGRPLEAIRMLFRENRVISSAAGDFDHKSCLEVLTNPELAERHFSFDECRMFRRHMLWTRVVGERRTLLPHHAEGDLLSYARGHRDLLVLKPNRSYGGDGIVIGASVSEAEWDAKLNEAVAAADDPEYSWVLQAATRLPVAEFPVVGADGRVFREPFYAVMGFAPTDHGLGVMCRVSQKQVVNVAQNGGMAAVLIADPPSELSAPRRSKRRSDGAVADLKREIAELLNLDNAIASLEWDEETRLPEGAHAERGRQLATLEAMRHGCITADSFGDLIEEAALGDNGDAGWARQIELLRDLRAGELTLEEDLVRAYAQARSASQAAWEEAREANDFGVFAPAFGEVLKLSRAWAAASDHDRDAYDVLMDEHEPGMTRARLDPVLAELRERLVPLVREAEARAQDDASDPAVMIGEGEHLEMSRRLLERIGFDFARGAIDCAMHPGTSALGFDDVRIAVRHGAGELTGLVLTALHEGGHGLYDQGYAAEDRFTLLAASPGAALHEGQARLWENHVGRSRAFWGWFVPTLGEAGRALSPAGLHRKVNRVQRGLHRASADELSYHLHIILRYELETALVAGELSVADLPGAWREKCRALFGLEPASDNEGVLQDGHWAGAMFGYFPTYTVGSLYAAQLVEAYGVDKLDGEIAAGSFAPLLGWLREKVHRHGDRLPAEDIMRNATGSGLDVEPFFRHVARKLKG